MPKTTASAPTPMDSNKVANADISMIPGLGMLNNATPFKGPGLRKVGSGNMAALLYHDGLPSAPAPTIAPATRGRPVNDYNPFPPESFNMESFMDIDGSSNLGEIGQDSAESCQPGVSNGSFFNPGHHGTAGGPTASMYLQGNGEVWGSTSNFGRNEDAGVGPSGQYMAGNSTYGYLNQDEAFYDEKGPHSKRSASVYEAPQQIKAEVGNFRIPKYSDRASNKDGPTFKVPSKPSRRNDVDDEDTSEYCESEFGSEKTDEESLFVSQKPQLGRGKKRARREEKEDEPERFNTGSYTNLRQPRVQTSGKPDFINHGQQLLDSRYSGATMPWGVNKAPDMVDQKDVSDAALLKRGIKRPRTDKICPRGYGANDPENIEIVNLKENKGIGFARISQILNERRLKTGKSPTLSATGVANRYNRTAPLLFAAEGKQFIPLSQRKKGTMDEPKIQWTSGRDTALVAAVKKYEANKWTTVAEMFNEMTGLDADDRSVAIRYSVL